MPIRVSCPDCRRELSPVPDHLAGEAVTCDFCGASARVPPRAVRAVARRVDPDDPTFRGEPPARRSNAVPIGLLVGGLVFAAVGGLVALAFALVPAAAPPANGRGPVVQAPAPPPPPHQEQLDDLRSDDAARRAAG